MTKVVVLWGDTQATSCRDIVSRLGGLIPHDERIFPTQSHSFPQSISRVRSQASGAGTGIRGDTAHRMRRAEHTKRATPRSGGSWRNLWSLGKFGTSGACAPRDSHRPRSWGIRWALRRRRLPDRRFLQRRLLQRIAATTARGSLAQVPSAANASSVWRLKVSPASMRWHPASDQPQPLTITG